MQLKEVNDVVLVSGLPSQEDALQLCSEIQKLGIKSTIGLLPGAGGYQVSIYRISLAETRALVARLGLAIQDDD